MKAAPKKKPHTVAADTGLSKENTSKFTGTDNPRHLRVITALLRRPISREELDSLAGASNGPELVAELRRRGLDAPCERVSLIDRDGQPCRPGVYSFTPRDRRLIHAWMAQRTRQKAAAKGVPHGQ